MKRKLYTNVPGTQDREKYDVIPFGMNNQRKSTVYTSRNNPYMITNSKWTPEQAAAFLAPVSPVEKRSSVVPQYSSLRKTKGMVTGPHDSGSAAAEKTRRDFAGGNPVMRQEKVPDYLGMIKDLKKRVERRKYYAPGFTGTAAAARIHTQRSRDTRAIDSLLTDIARESQRQYGQENVENIRGENRLAAERLAGESREKVQRLRNIGSLAGINERMRGEKALAQLRNKTEMDLAKLRARTRRAESVQAARRAMDAERIRAATRLLEKGVPGSQLGPLTGDENYFENIQIQQPVKKPKKIYVRPQFNNKGEMLPGTGIWVTEPTGGGGLNAELSPDDEKELADLYNSGNLNDFYARIMQIMQGQ